MARDIEVKFVEIDGDDLMEVIMMMATLISDCKKKPELLKMIPDDRKEIVGTFLHSAITLREERGQAATAAAAAIDKAKAGGPT